MMQHHTPSQMLLMDGNAVMLYRTPCLCQNSSCWVSKKQRGPPHILPQKEILRRKSMITVQVRTFLEQLRQHDMQYRCLVLTINQKGL
jgi:hypothetical protein